MSFRQGLTGNNGATAPSNNVPVSLAGCVAGDAVVVCLGYNFTTPTATTPSGWTLLSGPDDNGAGERTYLYGKVLTGADITAGSVTLALSQNARAVAAGIVVSNPTASPFGTPVKVVESGTAAAVTTTAANSVVAVFVVDTIAAGAPGPLTLSAATVDAEADTANASGSNVAVVAGHVNAGATGSYGGGTIGGEDALYQSYAIEILQAAAAATMDAGADQAGIEPGATVTLDSSGSTGVASGRTWSQVSGPAVTLSDDTATSPTFVAPPSLTAETLVFRVTDNATSAFDEVSIDVLMAARRVKLGGSMTPVYRRITLP